MFLKGHYAVAKITSRHNVFVIVLHELSDPNVFHLLVLTCCLALSDHFLYRY